MKKITVLLLIVTMITIGCSNTPQTESESAAVQNPETEAASDTQTEAVPELAQETETAPPVRIAGMKGATSMGMAMLLDQAERDEAGQAYEAQVLTAADDIMPKLLRGELDIAALPVNAASILWNRSDGAIRVIAVNTLGVLEVLEKGDRIHSLADLEGKTVYITGQGTVPEYSLRALAEQADVSFDAIRIEWKSEPAEITALLAREEEAVCILPQPFATVAVQKIEGLEKKLDFTDLWEETGQKGQFVTGVFVVRSEFADARSGAVDAFLADYEKSVQAVKASPEQAAEIIGRLGIVDAQLAQMAIPSMHLVSVQGKTMQESVEGFLGALHAANPESIGGNLPDASFYYK